ncbi:hypothetical protein PFICI_08849 [Pestalotiopsis fici W106-1]|uniref:Uncharacterized protein n=1 Tax=Pestalotiopsis fici (strain W106-1 / CGMCC3.15140) TaxID=1229662 RepID=W3X1F3_PESFW|nr:uncharacterized protein PFICI_08849 [Pestalotiopsis fici W106-1]ETS78996.1 hypothetical protein PFICI_08849 [Pestalotiopsis fici W106-1]
MVETIKATLETLAKDKSFQHLQKVITQNKELTQDNERLQSLNQGNLGNIADLTVQVRTTEKAAEKSRAELQSCHKKITSLSDSQEKVASQVTNLVKKLKESDGLMSDLQRKANQKQDRITNLEDELALEKKRLESATSAQKQLQTHLDTAKQRLLEARASLEGYTSLTREVVNLERDVIIRTLETIMSSICTLLITFVHTELSTDALSRVCKLANKFTNKFPNIPMLNSNSPDARHMRLAAAMFLAARALEEHIFQATYLLEGNILCQLLSDMAETDPVREAHVRAVLLPVDPPDDLIQIRIQQCVRQIESTVGLMVAESRKEEFSSALGQACEQICQYWMGLQRVEGSLEVNFNLHDSLDEDNYMLLSHFIPDDLEKVQRPGDPSTRSSNGQNAAKKGPQSVSYEQAGPVVWPAFIWKSPDRRRAVSLQNCIVLSIGQVDSARERSHREWRQARRESTSSTKPDDSKAGKDFLSGSSAKRSNPG